MATKEVLLDNVRVEIDGFHLRSIIIPDGYVSIAFNAHVDNHIVLPGDQLKEGMIIIAFDKLFRENPERLEPEYLIRNPNFKLTSQDRLNVSEKARWSIVTNLRTVGNIVKWTSLYGDGTMIARQYNKSIEWIVLKDFEATVFCDDCEGFHGLAEVLQDQRITTESGIEAKSAKLYETANEFLKDVADGLRRAEESTVRAYAENLLFNPNEKSSRYSKPASDLFSYAKEDAEATRNIFEAQNKLKERLWTNSLVGDLRQGDIFLIGGLEYRVVSIQPNDFEEFIVRVEPLESRGSVVPTLIFPRDFFFDVRRKF